MLLIIRVYTRAHTLERSCQLFPHYCFYNLLPMNHSSLMNAHTSGCGHFHTLGSASPSYIGYCLLNENIALSSKNKKCVNNNNKKKTSENFKTATVPRTESQNRRVTLSVGGKFFCQTRKLMNMTEPPAVRPSHTHTHTEQ